MRAAHLLPLLVPALLVTGCSGGGTRTTAGRLSAAEASGPPIATFDLWSPGATAVTYDQRVVPSGATAQVSITRSANGDSVRLTVAKLVPNRGYGAHLHTQPCAGAPESAGPHYQHQADPSKPSVDPRFANPRNEIWLDFSTDDEGYATAQSDQAWTFDPASPPKSLILHAEYTRTGKGEAGTAGARVACLTLESS